MIINIEEKIFCASLILQPLLRLYGIPVIGGTFADYILIIPLLVIIIKKGKKIRKLSTRTDAVELLPIMYCVMCNIIITWNSSFGVGNQLIYWIRYTLYYFILIYGIRSCYSIYVGFNIYKSVAIICTIFLIIQYIASTFWGIYIPGQFGPFALTDIKQQVENYNIYAKYNLFRPDSFFSEPAHYATFVSGFIAVCSLQETNKKNIAIMLFCSLGILISGSTTGLVMTVFVWICWIFRLLKNKRKVKYLIPILALAMFALVVVSKTDSFQLMIQRTFNSKDAMSSRFDWIETLDVLKTPIEWLYGLGNSSDVIHLTGWIPGWPIIFISYGIFGFFLYVLSYVVLFCHADKKGKFILIYIIIMGIGTEVVADMHVLVLLPFVINNTKIGPGIIAFSKEKLNINY